MTVNVKGKRLGAKVGANDGPGGANAKNRKERGGDARDWRSLEKMGKNHKGPHTVSPINWPFLVKKMVRKTWLIPAP